VRLSPLGTSATVGLLYQPQMIDDNYGAVGGMRIGRANRSTRRKPAPVLLCPPQIPPDLTWDRTRTSAVGSQQLTAWAMARPQRIRLRYIVKKYVGCRDGRSSPMMGSLLAVQLSAFSTKMHVLCHVLILFALVSTVQNIKSLLLQDGWA
jgi:hypothetical protein